MSVESFWESLPQITRQTRNGLRLCNNTVHLHRYTGLVCIASLVADKPGRRDGKRAMLVLCKHADRHGTAMFLRVNPIGENGPNKKGLIRFYRRFGFRAVRGGDAAMLRLPKRFDRATGYDLTPITLATAGVHKVEVTAVDDPHWVGNREKLTIHFRMLDEMADDGASVYVPTLFTPSISPQASLGKFLRGLGYDTSHDFDMSDLIGQHMHVYVDHRMSKGKTIAMITRAAKKVAPKAKEIKPDPVWLPIFLQTGTKTWWKEGELEIVGKPMSQVSKYAGVLGWDYTTHVAFRKLGVKSHLIDGIVYWGVLAAPETMFPFRRLQSPINRVETTTVETETPVWCSIGNGNRKQIINDLRGKSVSPLGIYS